MVADQVGKDSLHEIKKGTHGAIGDKVEKVLYVDDYPTQSVGLSLVIVLDHLHFGLEVSDPLDGFLSLEILHHGEIPSTLSLEKETILHKRPAKVQMSQL